MLKRGADEASEGGAVVFVCSDGIFSAITCRTSLLLVLLTQKSSVGENLQHEVR